MQRDSLGNVFKVAFLLCLVCSLLVSAAAVGLRPLQQANKERERKKNVLIAAGLFNPDVDDPATIETTFKQRIVPKLVDLGQADAQDDEGKLKEDQASEATEEDLREAGVVVEQYDQRQAAGDEQLSAPVPGADLARIRNRERFAFVYLVQDAGGSATKAVLPVRGYGLWSTMYGFLALDLTTLEDGPEHLEVAGLTFYEHGETPGLGGEIENQTWQHTWVGKRVYDADWDVQLDVAKGASGNYEVDALSGATITSNGVTNMVAYWLGPQGFRGYLKELAGVKEPVGEQ